MRKMLLGLLCLFTVTFFAQAKESDGCLWSWWIGAPAEYQSRDISGCVLGFGSGVKSISGSQVTVCANTADAVHSGAQVSFGYNRATTLRNGCQVGFVNVSDSAALQFGLLCFNRNGFLPFFPFFNFDKTAFGGKR
ncbi:MAG: hypothetical protein J6334_06680 [Kiritimatiellae bacterium]|nr:hypothetical protein [Kiritimatiellia bacterium]